MESAEPGIRIVDLKFQNPKRGFGMERSLIQSFLSAAVSPDEMEVAHTDFYHEIAAFLGFVFRGIACPKAGRPRLWLEGRKAFNEPPGSVTSDGALPRPNGRSIYPENSSNLSRALLLRRLPEGRCAGGSSKFLLPFSQRSPSPSTLRLKCWATPRYTEFASAVLAR